MSNEPAPPSLTLCLGWRALSDASQTGDEDRLPEKLSEHSLKTPKY